MHDTDDTVTDGLGHPIEGVSVTFTLPTGAASARFGPGYMSRTAVRTTGADGVAKSPALKATATAGGPYEATATAGGVAGTASFALTND